MSERITGDPRRRTVLKTLGTGMVVLGSGVGISSVSAQETGEIQITNVGTDAWEVVSADDANEAAVGEENPTLTLSEGMRYTFENDGGDDHPLEFRNDAGEVLLSQAEDGQFAEDGDVDYDEENDTVAFTVTQELGAELATYNCTIHEPMTGGIEVETTDDDGVDDDETDDEATDDTATDDEATDDTATDDEATDDTATDDTATDDDLTDDDGLTDDADDDGPGFGPVAGLAGVSGLAAYAYKKLGIETVEEDSGSENRQS